MRLLHATSDYELNSQTKPGFPILLWESMQSCHAANAFLRSYLCRGTIQSTKSWESTARALYDYFSYLEINQYAWDDVYRLDELDLLVGFRDYCQNVSKLKQNTTRNRLMYVCKFYEYALKKKLITELPFDYDDRGTYSRNGQLEHVYASGRSNGTPSVLPTQLKQVPKFLNLNQVQTLLQSVPNVHHNMMIRFALQTGLRREELATFPLRYMFGNLEVSGKRNDRLFIDPSDGSGIRTKGMRSRTIYMSHRLVTSVKHYVKHYRDERSSLTNYTRPELFLNLKGEQHSQGGKGFETILRRIGQRVGIDLHPHMLRHTYATHTLSGLQKSGRRNAVEPIVFLQHQLGHASINTTLIYLHLVNNLAEEAVLTYDDELNSYFKHD